jgi:hypothetical protein
VAAGVLRLAVSHPGFATLEAEYYPHQPKLQPGAAIRLSLTLPDGGPARRFQFLLEGGPKEAKGYTHRDAATDEAGRCEFRSLPPGSYTIRYVGSDGGRWAVPAIVMPALAKGEGREVRQSALAGSTLCGTVREARTGAPLRHAEVRFEGELYPGTASTTQAVYTDGEGRFAFGYAVAPGPLRVNVSAWHEGKRVGQWHQITVGRDARTELPLPSSNTGGVEVRPPSDAGPPEAEPRTSPRAAVAFSACYDKPGLRGP